jgi:hypothetical protein
LKFHRNIGVAIVETILIGSVDSEQM